MAAAAVGPGFSSMSPDMVSNNIAADFLGVLTGMSNLRCLCGFVMEPVLVHMWITGAGIGWLASGLTGRITVDNLINTHSRASGRVSLSTSPAVCGLLCLAIVGRAKGEDGMNKFIKVDGSASTSAAFVRTKTIKRMALQAHRRRSLEQIYKMDGSASTSAAFVRTNL